MTTTARRRRAATSRDGAPIGFVVLAALAVGFLAIPLIGLLGRTPWGGTGGRAGGPPGCCWRCGCR